MAYSGSLHMRNCVRMDRGSPTVSDYSKEEDPGLYMGQLYM